MGVGPVNRRFMTVLSSSGTRTDRACIQYRGMPREVIRPRCFKLAPISLPKQETSLILECLKSEYPCTKV